MILVDANILLNAHNQWSPCHSTAKTWWEHQLSGTSTVCLCWVVINAFIRIGTNPRIFKHPILLSQALYLVQGWLDQPCTRIIQPTTRHWAVFQELLIASNATVNLVTDAHLAALAIEHGCVLYSTDADFSQFPGLRWKNPLQT